MRKILRLWIGIAIWGAAANTALAAPSHPANGVLDEAGALPPEWAKTIGRILEEHRTATSESVQLWIHREPLATLRGDSLETFRVWKFYTPQPDSSVLLSVRVGREDSDRGDEVSALEIVVGPAMDAFFPPDRIESLRRRVFAPEASSGHIDRAIVLTVLEALSGMESPVIGKGFARAALLEAGWKGSFEPVAPARPGSSGVGIGVVLALLGLAYVLFEIRTEEAHYAARTAGSGTEAGWEITRRWWLFRKLRRLRRARMPSLVTGGGVSGDY